MLIPVLTRLPPSPGMYIKVVMNLFFYNNIICKNFDTEFIGLHPYMCQVGSLEQAYMKVLKDGQILDFNFYSVT